MVIGRDRILDWARYGGHPYWRVESTDGKTLGRRDEGAPDHDLSELATFLGFLAPGRYTLITFKSKDAADAKTHLKTQITIDSGGAASSEQHRQEPVNALGGIYGNDIQRYIQDQVRAGLNEAKIQGLEEEIKRLKGESPMSMTDAAMAAMLNGAGPYLIPALMGVKQIPPSLPAAQQPGPQGAPPQNHDASVRQDRLHRGLQTLNEMDPDLDVTISQLAERCKADPNLYQYLKSMLQQ